MTRSGRKIPLIGTVLVNERLITVEQLDVALEKQAVLKSKGTVTPIGEVLIAMGVIDEAQIRRALQLKMAASSRRP